MYEKGICQLLVVFDLLVERVGGEIDMQPDEHAAQWPNKVVDLCLAYDAPPVIFALVHSSLPTCLGGNRALETANFDNVFAVLENIADRVHPPFVIPSQALKPAHPAVGLPTLSVIAASGVSTVGAHDQLRDHGLDEPGRLLGAGFCDAQQALAESRLCRDPTQTTARS